MFSLLSHDSISFYSMNTLPYFPFLQKSSFLRKLLSKFVTVRAIKETEDVTQVDFTLSANQLDDANITIGITTKQRLKKLLDEGDILERQKIIFYKSVRSFFIHAASEALRKLPFSDEVLEDNWTFSSVEYFCARYSHILNFTPSDLDRLQEEFLDYQMLSKTDIPSAIWEEATVYEDDSVSHHRMDMIWGFIHTIRNNDGSKRFESDLRNSSKWLILYSLFHIAMLVI